MLPEAPGLFSTITGWPSALDSGSAMVRAAMSGVEPPGKPTTRRIGLVGQVGVLGGGQRKARAGGDQKIFGNKHGSGKGMKGEPKDKADL